MKKYLFAAAVAATVLSACSQNEAIESAGNEVNKAIDFSTFVGQSRAAIMDLPGLKAEEVGFYVMGYYTGSTDWTNGSSDATLNFMAPENVTWSETNWTYTNTKYWPNEVDGTNLGKVSFFAYSPAASSDLIVAPNALTGTGAPTLTYTCPTAVADQVDLIADAVPNQTKITNEGKVAFTFNHLLSKIAFSAKLAAEYADATVTIKKLEVTYGTGLVQKNVYKMDTEAWSTSSDDQTNYGDDAGKGVIYDNETGQVLVWGEGVATPYDFSTATSTNFLMLHPQSTSEGDLKATLTYTVKDNNRTDAIVIENKVTADLPAIEWEKGKQYTYNLAVSLTGVTFEVTDVTAWASDETQPSDTNI